MPIKRQRRKLIMGIEDKILERFEKIKKLKNY